ncbi:hypothetical protein PG997_000222 [Apiospora hydei]|uniref:Tat pathway signal sequence n=1 Tax=Apiospora hydei TaxID=1337664 RepID=A0ABR1XA53_9PEZI
MPEPPYLQVPGDDIDNIDHPQHTTRKTPWLPLKAACVVFASFTVGCLVTYPIAAYTALSGAQHAPGNNLKVPSFPQFAPESDANHNRGFPTQAGLDGAPSEENQRVWDALVPIGRGFVNVSSPETYGLLRGIPSESGVDRYSMAMYHQLHCLGVLRAQFWKLVDMSEPGWTDAARLEAVRHIVRSRHAQHCIAYLVQGVQCSADLTVEWADIGGKG